MKKFSIKEAVGFGWGNMKSNLWFFVGVLLFMAGVGAAGKLCQVWSGHAGAAAKLAVALIFGCINIILQMGIVRISLRFCDGEKAAFMDLFSRARFFISFLGASILYALIMVAPGIVLAICVPLAFKFAATHAVLRIVLFVVIAVFVYLMIMLAIKYSQYPYFILDRGARAVEALKGSATITYGAKWELFLLGLVVTGMNILGALCLLIGLFATVPTTILAGAFVYRKLLVQSGLAAQTPDFA